MQRKRALLLLAISVALLVSLASCGSDAEDGGDYSGAEDYVQAMCAATAGRTTQQNATWGELREDMALNLELIDDISPPPNLQAFHDASVDLMRAVAELGAKFPPSEEVPADNVLWGHPELASSVQTLFAAESALPDEVLATVANCP